jgi:hypothetical protein
LAALIAEAIGGYFDKVFPSAELALDHGAGDGQASILPGALLPRHRQPGALLLAEEPAWRNDAQIGIARDVPSPRAGPFTEVTFL